MTAARPINMGVVLLAIVAITLVLVAGGRGVSNPAIPPPRTSADFRPEPAALPSARLDIALTAIIAGKPQQASAAFQVNGGAVYWVGLEEPVAAGYVLEEIHRDHVVIRNAEHRQKIFLVNRVAADPADRESPQAHVLYREDLGEGRLRIVTTSIPGDGVPEAERPVAPGSEMLEAGQLRTITSTSGDAPPETESHADASHAAQPYDPGQQRRLVPIPVDVAPRNCAISACDGT